jgi:hypothetical protein
VTVAHEVFIFCNGRNRRPHGDVPVTTFVHREGGDWYEKLPLRDGPSTMTTLDGDVPVERGGDRLRWEFKCDECGRLVPARREKLIPVLDKLAEAGLPHISLGGLAARL